MMKKFLLSIALACTCLSSHAGSPGNQPSRPIVDEPVVQSYTLQANPPTVSVGGRVFAVGAFVNISPVGNEFVIGVYELTPTGYNQIGIAPVDVFMPETGQSALLLAVQAAGGIDNYFNNAVIGVNNVLRTIFASSPPVTPPANGEPISNADAVNMLIARINGLRLILVGGQLVLTR